MATTLNWAMNYIAGKKDFSLLTERQKIVINIYNSRHRANLHKMIPIPVCEIPKEIK